MGTLNEALGRAPALCSALPPSQGVLAQGRVCKPFTHECGLIRTERQPTGAWIRTDRWPTRARVRKPGRPVRKPLQVGRGTVRSRTRAVLSPLIGFASKVNMTAKLVV